MPFYSPDRSLPQPYRHFPPGPGTLAPAPYNYARRFDGVDDELWVPGGQNTTIAGKDFTIAALVRLNKLWVDQNIASIFITNMTAAGGNALYLAVNSTTFGATATVFTAATQSSGTIAVTPDWGWFVIVVSKTAGTSTPRLHLYHPGHPSANATGWIHEDGSAAAGNHDLWTGGTVRFGSWILSQHYSYDIALAAEWIGAMSDGQVEALTTNQATTDWYFHSMANPTGLWEFNQYSTGIAVNDQAGNGSDVSFLMGTEVLGSGPYPWTFWNPGDATIPHMIERPDLNQQPLVPA